MSLPTQSGKLKSYFLSLNSGYFTSSWVWGQRIEAVELLQTVHLTGNSIFRVMEALLKICLSVLASHSQHPALDITQIALLDVSYVTLNNATQALPLSFTDGHHFIMLLWVLISKQFFTCLLVLGHFSLVSRHTLFISLYQASWLQLVALKIAVHMTVSDAGAGWWIY